ncbi:hypothetical protein Hdeb2414_s0129g00806171 [Helianthus debilis subsp. tardiflorus]
MNLRIFFSLTDIHSIFLKADSSHESLLGTTTTSPQLLIVVIQAEQPTDTPPSATTVCPLCPSFRVKPPLAAAPPLNGHPCENPAAAITPF